MALLTHAKDAATADGHERRVNLRLNCSGIVEIGFFPDKTVYDATLYDISMGGCGLKIENHAGAQMNSLVEMKIKLHGLTLHVLGVVRSVLGTGERVGIEFTDVQPAQAIRLYQVMGDLMDKSNGKHRLI